MREIILLLTGEKAGAGRAPTPEKPRPQCREQHIKSSTWSKTITNIQKMVISDFPKGGKVGWVFFPSQEPDAANPLGVGCSERGCGVRCSRTGQVHPTPPPGGLGCPGVCLTWEMCDQNTTWNRFVLFYAPCEAIFVSFTLLKICLGLKSTCVRAAPPVLLPPSGVIPVFYTEIKGYSGSFYNQVESTEKVLGMSHFGPQCLRRKGR